MKKQDPDLLCIKQCIKSLKKSTSEQMLKANIKYLTDRFFKK